MDMGTIKWLLLSLILSSSCCNGQKRSGSKSGYKYAAKKVVGGLGIGIWEIPYQGSIEYGGIFRCGAALIAPTWLTTAAHCLFNMSLIRDKTKVRLGSSYRSRGGYVYPVEKFVWHPNYEIDRDAYDIGLTELRMSVQEDQNKIHIPLVRPGEVTQKLITIRVSGFGMDRDGPSLGLKAVDIETVDNALCEIHLRLKNRTRVLQKTMFCASPIKGAPCAGDSGGPAAFKKRLFGIIAKGGKCLLPSSGPSIYMKVSEFFKWILSVTNLPL